MRANFCGRIASLLSAVVLAAACGSADAGFITYNLNSEFSGATPPAGAAPWLTATFLDVSSTAVKLTLNAAGLTGSEFVSGFYFNFDPGKSLAGLSVVFNAGASSVMTVDSIGISSNAYKADGDGEYDVLLSFSTSAGVGRFADNEIAVFDISHAGGITFNDFTFLSNPAGGKGPFYVAAHVQGIGSQGKDSGWITGPSGGGGFEIPEPTSIVLLGSGMLGAMFAGRRRRQAA